MEKEEFIQRPYLYCSGAIFLQCMIERPKLFAEVGVLFSFQYSDCQSTAFSWKILQNVALQQLIDNPVNENAFQRHF